MANMSDLYRTIKYIFQDKTKFSYLAQHKNYFLVFLQAS